MTQVPPGGDKASTLDMSVRELGQYETRYRELAARPVELLGNLRADTDFAAAFCRADTIPYLLQWFSRREGWAYDRQRSGPAGPEGVMIEWTYDGVHDTDGAFNGMTATGRQVLVRGVSIAGVQDGALKMRRYVDWAGLFAQLGLSLNWRVPIPSGGAAGGRV